MTSPCIATVFGGTGFLGQAVVQALAARGYLVRVPTRDMEKAHNLKVMGTAGQITPFLATLKTDAAVTTAIAGSDVVINLIGILAETKNQNYQTVHVETAARLARIARTENVQHFVHVSALGADMRATARYARTKAIGEEAVRAFFPSATIMRPSLLFGPGDSFLSRLAWISKFSPFLPLFGGGTTKFQPLYVGDAATAIIAALDRKEAKGKLYALGGPSIYTFRELIEIVLRVTQRKRILLPLPWRMAKILCWFMEKLPAPPLTRDQLEMLKSDSIVPARSSMFHIESLGVRPHVLDSIAPDYLF